MSKAAAKSIPAFVLKSLADLPPSFDMPVQIPILGKSGVTITLTCNALGKLEWAAVRDADNAEAERRREERIQAVVHQTLDAPASTPVIARAVDAVADELNRRVSMVLQFATGWDLSDPLNAETLLVLENKGGGSLAACINAYETAIYQGRLGN
jgi:hypothetical protein